MRYPLGDYATTALAKAWAVARDKINEIDRGADPAADRKAKNEGPTLREVFELRTKLGRKLKETTIAGYRSYLDWPSVQQSHEVANPCRYYRSRYCGFGCDTFQRFFADGRQYLWRDIECFQLRIEAEVELPDPKNSSFEVVPLAPKAAAVIREAIAISKDSP